MNSIIGKTYLVTGATSGIGKAVTLLLLQQGAKVLMVGRNNSVLSDLYHKYPDTSLYIEYDLSNPTNIDLIFQKASSAGYVFDGMVYCAGICPLIKCSDISYDSSLNVFNVNYFSFTLLAKYFLNPQYAKEGASIVAISSNAAIIGGNRQADYSASKAALNIFVKSVTKELSFRRIRINSVLPSATETELIQKLRNVSTAIDTNIAYKQPFGIIDPNDVGNVVLFLLSDYSKAISGTLISVNNGDVY